MDIHGIVFDIDHFAVHDGPGIRTVVYLKGCPLRCIWCHSPESHIKDPQLLRIADRCKNCEVCINEKCVNQATVMSGRSVSVSEIVSEVVQNKIFFDSSGGGVTLSGGEILYQPEFSLSLLEQFQSCGIHTAVETSGMGKWEWLRDISRCTDIFYYDIKILDNDKHIIYTGTGNELILQNLRKLAEHRHSKCITLRVPLIPAYNDSPDDIEAVYRLACELNISGVHLLRYNISAPAKYQWLGVPYKPGNLERQSDAYIDMLCKIAPREISVVVF